MTEPTQPERRRYTRVALDTEVDLIQGDKRFRCDLLDISLNGLLVASAAHRQIRPAEPCTVEVLLTDSTHITMQCTLAHSSPSILGFQCTSLDIDSAAHLRRLIEFNMPDCEASDRALSELLQRIK